MKGELKLNQTLKKLKDRQKGASPIAIAISGIALLGVITMMAIGKPSSALSNQKMYENVSNHIMTIRTQLNACAALEGNNGCNESTECRNSALPRADASYVSILTSTCPGTGGNLWSIVGISTQLRPNVIPNSGFGSWEYLNSFSSGFLIRQQITDATIGNNILNYITNKGHTAVYSGGYLIVTIMP